MTAAGTQQQPQHARRVVEVERVELAPTGWLQAVLPSGGRGGWAICGDVSQNLHSPHKSDTCSCTDWDTRTGKRRKGCMMGRACEYKNLLAWSSLGLRASSNDRSSHNSLRERGPAAGQGRVRLRPGLELRPCSHAGSIWGDTAGALTHGQHVQHRAAHRRRRHGRWPGARLAQGLHLRSGTMWWNQETRCQCHT
jgi:hypothetical protein